LVVSNGGNAPAVVEQILMGADDGVVSFDLNPLSADKRVIRANGINVFALRLDIENSVDSVWELVKIFRSNGSCQLRLDVISPNGKRTTTDVDVSSAGMEKSEEKNGCPLKLRKLSTMTLTALGKRPEYVTTLCKVAELHPRDPKHPEVGSACKK